MKEEDQLVMFFTVTSNINYSAIFKGKKLQTSQISMDFPGQHLLNT